MQCTRHVHSNLSRLQLLSARSWEANSAAQPILHTFTQSSLEVRSISVLHWFQVSRPYGGPYLGRKHLRDALEAVGLYQRAQARPCQKMDKPCGFRFSS